MSRMIRLQSDRRITFSVPLPLVASNISPVPNQLCHRPEFLVFPKAQRPAKNGAAAIPGECGDGPDGP